MGAPHPACERPLHPLPQPRRWLLNYAFNNVAVAITALLEAAALEDDARGGETAR